MCQRRRATEIEATSEGFLDRFDSDVRIKEFREDGNCQKWQCDVAGRCGATVLCADAHMSVLHGTDHGQHFY
jgi:hypothetical protein